jgi:hypothetical protein
MSIAHCYARTPETTTGRIPILLREPIMALALEEEFEHDHDEVVIDLN